MPFPLPDSIFGVNRAPLRASGIRDADRLALRGTSSLLQLIGSYIKAGHAIVYLLNSIILTVLEQFVDLLMSYSDTELCEFKQLLKSEDVLV